VVLISLLHTLHELRYHYASMGVSPAVSKVLLRLALQVRGGDALAGVRTSSGLASHFHIYHCAGTPDEFQYPICNIDYTHALVALCCVA
jgi:hypothetical protein